MTEKMFSPATTDAAYDAVDVSKLEASKALQEASTSGPWDVLIIGAGISGSQAALHLAETPNGPKRVLIVDHGQAGAGSKERIIAKGANIPMGEEKSYHVGNSGGVIFSAPHFTNGPTRLKFSVRLYPATTPRFIEHHGKAGTRRYLEFSAHGIQTQKTMCKRLFPDPSKVLEETGSLLLAEEADLAGLKEEFALLNELGCTDIEWWDKNRVEEVHGKDAGFVAAIYFPNDVRLDSLQYTNAVLDAALKSQRGSGFKVIPYSPSVVDVRDLPNGSGSVTTFTNGKR
eukprot:PhF_6_TR5516/c0_g1_i1/m.7824